MNHKEPAQLLGLASASMPGSFTTVETAIALLYDSLKVEWISGNADPKRMPSANFAILASPAARGRSIQLELRGFAQPAGCGSVDLSIGGLQINVRPTDESFSTRVSAALSADADVTPVIATLNLPKPADGSAASLTLDSIDVSLPARRGDAA